MDKTEILTRELKKILPFFIKEFKEYIPPTKLEYLKDNENISNIIQFSDNGMGAYTDIANGKIFYANINKLMFERLKLHPAYGKKKNSQLIKPEEFVNNKKDYLDYINYCIEKGYTELDYCLDVLPHEIMHLIGFYGGVIGEGVTELRTRQVCQKYNIRCAPILHSKETEVVMKLDKLLGKEILNRASFEKDNSKIEQEIDKNCGTGKFRQAYEQMVIEYNKYQGNNLKNPIEHYKEYRNINYSNMLNLVKKLEEKQRGQR